MSEGVGPLRRALRLNPHPNAAVYLIWELTADPEGDLSMLAEADSLARTFDHPSLVPGIAAVRAHRNQDSLGFVLAIDSIMTLFSNQKLNLFGTNTAMTIIQVGTFWGSAPDLAEVIRVAEFVSDTIRHSDVYDGHPRLTNVAQVDKYDRLNQMHAGLGQWRDSRKAARALEGLGNALGLIQMALLATIPIPGPIPIDPDSIRHALEAWDVEHSSAPFKLYDTEMRRYGHPLRLYALALLSALQGDNETAMRYVAELEVLEPIDNTPTMHLDLAAGVRADVLLRQGRPAEALGALDDAPWRRHYSEEVWLPGQREIFMRARIHQALGNHAEALRWYRSSPSGMGAMAPTLLAPSHYWRGEIYEELGDTEKALFHYSQFVRLWRDADPEYQPAVEEVRGRMARLATEG